MNAFNPAADPRWRNGYSTSDSRLPVPRRHQSVGLTASARRMNERETAYMKRLSQPWQLRALSYHDTIGEIRFTSSFLARQISRVRFYPARRLEDGTTEPIDAGLPVDLLNQIQDPGGGTSQVQFDYGRLMFLTGEGVLFGTDEGTRWQFLWKDEVKQMADGTFVRLNFQMEPNSGPGVAYRVWSPHPRWSDLADAPMMSVMDICELILLLTMGQRSTAVTRMTKGLLLIPQEASFAPLEPGLDEDPQQNPFMSDMLEHMSNQIENPGTAPASMPFAAEMAAEFIKEARWMQLHDPATDYQEKDSLEFQIRRLSLSLDMSPEDLMGYTDANHWTARSVQLDRWRMFGVSKAELWAQSIAEAYLRPALERDGYNEVPVDQVVINFDDSQVVINPDRTEDALKAHGQLLISGKAARTALGWAEKDAMTGDELDQNLALKLREPALLGDEFMPPERGPMPQNQNGNGNAADGPPLPGTNTGVSRQESVRASGAVLGAAHLALHRCRELAGVRLRYKCPDCGGDSPHSLVASALGPKGAPNPDKLVAGGTDVFGEYLTDQGMEPAHAAALCKQLEVFAARTLYEPRCPELPSGFVAAVNQAQEVSGVIG